MNKVFYFVRLADGSLETRTALTTSVMMSNKLSKLNDNGLFLVCQDFKKGELYSIEDMEQNVYTTIAMEGKQLTPDNSRRLLEWFLEMPFSAFRAGMETATTEFDWRKICSGSRLP